MKKYDAVRLIRDQKELTENGIRKGFEGVLILPVVTEERWYVLFFNPRNCGEYAVAIVESENLEKLGDLPAEVQREVEAIKNRPDFFTHTVLKQSTVREYDCVELLVDRPRYAREGVHKGMRGVVMSAYSIGGEWQVIFSDENGFDIADVGVAEEDFRVLKDSP